MNKYSISDFIQQWDKFDTVISQKEPIQFPWEERFKQAGYYSAVFNGHVLCWDEVQEWCKLQYGIDHYSWFGSRFFFEKEKDKMLFILKWN